MASCPFADSVDRYGRRLAYVKVDVQNVALTLIHTGMAAAWRPGSEPQSTRYTDYRAAERAARPHTGLWATCETLGCEETPSRAAPNTDLTRLDTQGLRARRTATTDRGLPTPRLRRAPSWPRHWAKIRWSPEPLCHTVVTPENSRTSSGCPLRFHFAEVTLRCNRRWASSAPSGWG